MTEKTNYPLGKPLFGSFTAETSAAERARAYRAFERDYQLSKILAFLRPRDYTSNYSKLYAERDELFSSFDEWRDYQERRFAQLAPAPAVVATPPAAAQPVFAQPAPKPAPSPVLREKRTIALPTIKLPSINLAALNPLPALRAATTALVTRAQAIRMPAIPKPTMPKASKAKGFMKKLVGVAVTAMLVVTAVRQQAPAAQQNNAPTTKTVVTKPATQTQTIVAAAKPAPARPITVESTAETKTIDALYISDIADIPEQIPGLLALLKAENALEAKTILANAGKDDKFLLVTENSRQQLGYQFAATKESTITAGIMLNEKIVARLTSLTTTQSTKKITPSPRRAAQTPTARRVAKAQEEDTVSAETISADELTDGAYGRNILGDKTIGVFRHETPPMDYYGP